MGTRNEEWLKVRAELEPTTTFSPIQKIASWLALGCPAPPPNAYKQALVQSYAKSYKTPLFVETGTYYGEMLEACMDHFDELYSIELGYDLYKIALGRFKGSKRVKLYHGDSGEMLPRILKKIKAPAIFWLDAHYSAGETAKGALDTPIAKELESILTHRIKNHIILIDDARLFNGQNDYPTMEELYKLIKKHSGLSTVINRHDIIRIQPDKVAIEV